MPKTSRATRMVVQVCQNCGGEFPVRRLKSKLKDRAHIKTMYCPWCMEDTDHKPRRLKDG